MNAIQFIESATSQDNAAQMLEGIRLLDGCIGGRVLTGCRVQYFFSMEFADGCELLGGRKVLIMDSQRISLGMTSAITIAE